MRDLSNRIENIEASAIMAISSKAAELSAQGLKVISFGAGEPDFDVAGHIKQAAIEAINLNYSKYTFAEGLPELRSELSVYLERRFGVSYSPSETIVTSGAKQALFITLQALCSEGDEIIIPVPAWVSYSEMAKIAGIVPLLAPTKKEKGFVLDPDDLRMALTPKTKALVLNNPSNPTGAVYTKEQLGALLETCLEEGIYIISDEIYSEFVYGNSQFVSMAASHAGAKDAVVLVNGFSKSYAMPGWRVGYAAAPQHIIDAMGIIQSHTVSHPSVVSMYAAAKALAHGEDFLEGTKTEYARRRKAMGDALSKIPGLGFSWPQGAFYFFVDIKGLVGKIAKGGQITGGISFANMLLEQSHVACVPGEFFGAADHVRLSYSSSFDEIMEGMERIAEFVGSLR
ncbi:MAG: pyridoxal phosphate-dependent aminotransferase [Eubacteriaceae bacterium]|nr:pyridoxal phosphate-dependent aminotransferase [Eubacteriaceae bacterium]